MYLIDAGPVPVGLLQEPGEGLLLPLPDDGARQGGGHVAAAVHHGAREEEELDLAEHVVLDHLDQCCQTKLVSEVSGSADVIASLLLRPFAMTR